MADACVISSTQKNVCNLKVCIAVVSLENEVNLFTIIVIIIVTHHRRRHHCCHCHFYHLCWRDQLHHLCLVYNLFRNVFFSIMRRKPCYNINIVKLQNDCISWYYCWIRAYILSPTDIGQQSYRTTIRWFRYAISFWRS